MTTFVVTKLSPELIETVVSEEKHLDEAQKVVQKMRKELPDGWLMQIYEKPYYLRLRKWRKQQKLSN